MFEWPPAEVDNFDTFRDESCDSDPSGMSDRRGCAEVVNIWHVLMFHNDAIACIKDFTT